MPLERPFAAGYPEQLSMQTVRESLWKAKEELAFLGPEEAAASAEFLMAEITGLNRGHLYLTADRRLTAREEAQFLEGIRRRKGREPLAYILGKAPFWNQMLKVGPGCLIPRPETETLIEKFIENSGWGRREFFSFLDLGTGSGAIAVALLLEYPFARGCLADRSAEALRFAQINLKTYGISARADVIQADLFSSFAASGTQWDAIVSNPPYFSSGDWEKTEPEILKEPMAAFEAGSDGLAYYRRITAEAPVFMKPGGILMLETGKGQAAVVKDMMQENGFGHIQSFQDDLGIERVVTARRGI